MKIEKKDGILIISPSGKLDTISAPDFNKELLALLAEKPDVCIIDLQDISFLSSAGLQSLLTGVKIAKKENIKYAVCSMNEMVNDVFTLSGFDRFIDKFDDIKVAIENL